MIRSPRELVLTVLGFLALALIWTWPLASGITRSIPVSGEPVEPLSMLFGITWGAHALADNKAAILRNHGLLTVGQSVEEAAWWFITMERSCHAQLMAESVGTPVLIEPEMAAVTRGQVGNHIAGWFSGPPLFASITREQPDLFGRAMVVVGLAEGVAIYGLIVAVLILGKV